MRPLAAPLGNTITGEEKSFPARIHSPWHERGLKNTPRPLPRTLRISSLRDPSRTIISVVLRLHGDLELAADVVCLSMDMGHEHEHVSMFALHLNMQQIRAWLLPHARHLNHQHHRLLPDEKLAHGSATLRIAVDVPSGLHRPALEPLAVKLPSQGNVGVAEEHRYPTLFQRERHIPKSLVLFDLEPARRVRSEVRFSTGRNVRRIEVDAKRIARRHERQRIADRWVLILAVGNVEPSTPVVPDHTVVTGAVEKDEPGRPLGMKHPARVVIAYLVEELLAFDLISAGVLAENRDE